MQLARFVLTVVLFVMLGLASFVAGCGSGGGQGSSAEEKAAGKIIAEATRKSHQESRKLLKARAADQDGAIKRRSRAKS
jgi:hypothetical protein